MVSLSSVFWLSGEKRNDSVPLEGSTLPLEFTEFGLGGGPSCVSFCVGGAALGDGSGVDPGDCSGVASGDGSGVDPGDGSVADPGDCSGVASGDCSGVDSGGIRPPPVGGGLSAISGGVVSTMAGGDVPDTVGSCSSGCDLAARALTIRIAANAISITAITTATVILPRSVSS